MKLFAAPAPKKSARAPCLLAAHHFRPDAKPPAKRILVVDDDRDIMRGMLIRLRSRGYETMEACDGRTGVDGALRDHPDAIVMDVRMPVMDGLQALGLLQLQTITHDIPVIMLSASLSDRQAALDAGARFFISKPYQSEMLIAALEDALFDDHSGMKKDDNHA